MPGLGVWERLRLLIPITAAGWAGDQIAKRWAAAYLKDAPRYSYWHDILRIEYAQNAGAFLSLGATLPKTLRFLVLTVGTGLLLAGVAAYALRAAGCTRRDLVGVSLILAGGFGNWFDRVLFDGYVIDFLNVGIGGLRTGIFNIADLLVEAGAIVLILNLRGRHHSERSL